MSMKLGNVICDNEGCYQSFRLGGECPMCWMKEAEE